MALLLEPLRTKSDREAFIRFPWKIFSDDPNWVPPLLMDRRNALVPGAAIFKHMDFEGWLAFDGKEPVGRISAQIERLNSECGRPDLGYFGMVDAVDDAAVWQALTAQAESWLSERGMKRVHGPFNLGVNQEVGLQVEGFDTPPYFMMGHGRPYYPERLEEQGYKGVQDMLAYEVDTRFEAPPAMLKIIERLGERLVIRPINRKERDKDLAIVCEIFNDAWAENWGFVPWPLEEFLAIGHEMLLLIDDGFIQIAEVDGEPMAFIVLLPNLNEALRDINGRLLPFGWAKLLWRLKVKYPTSGRVPLMGVRRQHHNTRMGAGLAFGVISKVRDEAVARGLNKAEMSWILEDNLGMRSIIEALGAHINKRYRMFEKVL